MVPLTIVYLRGAVRGSGCAPSKAFSIGRKDRQNVGTFSVRDTNWWIQTFSINHEKLKICMYETGEVLSKPVK